MRHLILSAGLAFLMVTGNTAKSKDYDIYGYAKYLFSSTSHIHNDDRLADHLLHSRINTRWYPAQNVFAAMELRLRAWYGDSPEMIPGFKDQIRSDHEFGNMDYFPWEEKRSVGYGEIDRLYIDYSRHALQITAGRQRIAWGTTLVWNITDLFNPMSVLDFDYEERPGVDALRLRYYTGPVSRAEMVIRPGKDTDRSTWAALWMTNALEYDFYLLGALQNNRWVAGGGWDGNIRGGGFRGEMKLSEAPHTSRTDDQADPGLYEDPFLKNKDMVFSGTISGDYTFSNSFYIHTEALFNSNGVRRNAGMLYNSALKYGMLSPARWSLFQEFAYDVTPLIRATLFTIRNPDDGSSVTVPMFNWSVVTNWDLMLIGFITSGGRLTEYGDYGNAGFVRLKYAF